MIFSSVDSKILERDEAIFISSHRSVVILHRFFVFLFVHARFFSSIKEEEEEEEKGGEK